MKKHFAWIATTLLLTSNYAFSATEKNYTEKDVLSEIDSICGDTWCEGDFGFSFKKVTCQSSSCTVNFQMTLEPYLEKKISEKGEDYSAQLNDVSGKYRYNVACELPGMKSYNEMLRKDDGVTENYYSAFTSCIFSLEKMIRDRVR